MCKRAVKLSEFQDAFDLNPLKNEKELKEFYQDTSLARTGDKYSDFVHRLVLQLENSQEVYQHKLFVGHPGCGKTTELYQLLRHLKKKKFVVHMGRCDLELDSADIEYTDVLFLILDSLLKAAEERNIILDKKLIASIREYWEQDVEIVQTEIDSSDLAVSAQMEGKAGIASLIKVMSTIKGTLKNSLDTRRQLRQRIEPRSSELIRRIQMVIDELSRKSDAMGLKKIPLIILDGLDKIPLEQARKIFRENGSRFSSLRMHLIVTFPIALTYTPEYNDILSWFPDPDKLPMIKLKKWENGAYIDGYTEGIDTMRRLVEKRADLALFEEDVLETLIKKTGGYIRDLFRCISKAALRAQIRGARCISLDDAGQAVNSLKSDINGRYNEDMVSVMKTIYNGQKYLSNSDLLTKLLQLGAVLEYNGERWCDLHPLVEEWLVEHKKWVRQV